MQEGCRAWCMPALSAFLQKRGRYASQQASQKGGEGKRVKEGIEKKLKKSSFKLESSYNSRGLCISKRTRKQF